jgi:hypothetical protein
MRIGWFLKYWGGGCKKKGRKKREAEACGEMGGVTCCGVGSSDEVVTISKVGKKSNKA